MDLTPQTRRTLLICVGLSAMTLAVFWPVTEHDFINCDDPAYVTLNAHVLKGLSWGNVGWAFSTVFYDYYHPLAWLSHMLDVQLFGVKPGWHHLTSLLIHLANTLLLFRVLCRMTGAVWRSAFVAALFALHPLHVESVAWVTERKDVLSAFFFLLTLLAYERFANYDLRFTSGKVASAKRGGRWAWYGLTLGLYALGLMSKPMLVTLPCVLLLLDYWPLRRIAECGARSAELGEAARPAFTPLARLLVEKAPFFMLSAATCVVTVLVQTKVGVVPSLATVSLTQRVSNALMGYAIYLRQTFWPAGLATFYPLRQWPPEVVAAAGALLLGITAWAVSRARRSPHLAVGWFWFLGMLVPVIGLVQSGAQQTADRYTYLPLVGVFVMVVWELADRLGGWRRGRAVLGAAGAGVLLACAALTSQQVSWWQDTVRLFQHVLDVTGDNYIAHNNLAGYFYLRGQMDGAIEHYQASLAIEPGQTHQLEIHYYLGDALSRRGRYAEAIEQFSELLKSSPDNEPALVALGIAQAKSGKPDEAVQALSEALRIRPGDAAAHNSLGNVLAQQGKPEEAVRQFEEAVRLKPEHAGAHNNLAISLSKLGRTGEAISHYREAIRWQPDFLAALNNLAWLLAAQPDARLRNGAEAVTLATRACELTKYQNPTALATLGAAYAETGRFQEAVSFTEQAEEAVKGSQGPLAERVSAMLKAFRAGQPYYAE